MVICASNFGHLVAPLPTGIYAKFLSGAYWTECTDFVIVVGQNLESQTLMNRNVS